MEGTFKQNTMIKDICKFTQDIISTVSEFTEETENEGYEIIFEDMARIKLIREYPETIKHSVLKYVEDSCSPYKLTISRIYNSTEDGTYIEINPEVFSNVNIGDERYINIFVPDILYNSNLCTMTNALYIFYDIAMKLANLDIYRSTVIEPSLLDDMVFDSGDTVNTYDIKLLLAVLVSTRIAVSMIGFDNVEDAMPIFLKDLGYDESTVDIFIAKLFDQIAVRNPSLMDMEFAIHAGIGKMLS